METETQAEQLNAIVDRLLDRDSNHRATTILGQFDDPFDTSRPNIHDSKKEFVMELATVETVVNHIQGVLNQLVSPEEKTTQHKQMIERLRPAIESGARQKLRNFQADSASDLALRNMVDTGFYYNSIFLLLDMLNVYHQRLTELNDQKKQFWSVPHRAPNYYARTISLRLARLYAKERRQRPTFGIAREGNHPSTDFGRALEEVFSILNIRASVRNAAEWAISHLTEDDLNPPVNHLRLGLGAAMGVSSLKPGRNALAEISNLLEKGT